MGFENIGVMFPVALPWLALIALFSALATWQHPIRPTNMLDIKLTALDYATLAVNFIGLSSIAVTWHRHVIAHENPRLVPPFRIDKPVIGYGASNLLLGLVLALPLSLLIILAVILPVAFVPFVAGAMIIFSIFTIRLSLRLVAIAISKPDLTFQKAFETTRGNNFAILCIMLGAMLATLVAAVIAEVLAKNISQINLKLDLPLSILFAIPAQFVGLIVINAMLSTLYLYFVEGKDL